MSGNEYRDLLASIPLFAHCSDSELEAVAHLSSPLKVRAGTSLATEGKLGQEFGVILEGQAKVVHDGHELAQLGRGDYFGEVALIEGLTRTASVIATTDVELLVIDRREFVTLLEAVPGLTRSLLTAVTHRLREALEELDRLRSSLASQN